MLGDTIELVHGGTECFKSSDIVPLLCQDEVFSFVADIIIAGIVVIFIFCSVVGNCLVTAIFRVFHIVRQDTSVSHLCMSQLALSDLLYGIFVMPLSLSLLYSNNRFNLGFEEDDMNVVTYQLVGMLGDICTRVSILLITIVTVDHMTVLCFPRIHNKYFSMISIKTAIGVSWVFCIVIGILPFMVNEKYVINVDVMSSQWTVYVLFESPKARLWAYSICLVVPILIPGIFITFSNMILAFKMGVSDEQAGPQDQQSRKFSIYVRSVAMKMAAGAGKIGRGTGSNMRSRNDKPMTKEEVMRQSLRSLRPITTTYIICNFIWIVSVAHDWVNVLSKGDKDSVHGLFDNWSTPRMRSYLKVIAILLYYFFNALTPILHFTCSLEMKQGLAIMMSGYTSEAEYKLLQQENAHAAHRLSGMRLEEAMNKNSQHASV